MGQSTGRDSMEAWAHGTGTRDTITDTRDITTGITDMDTGIREMDTMMDIPTDIIHTTGILMGVSDIIGTTKTDHGDPAVLITTGAEETDPMIMQTPVPIQGRDTGIVTEAAPDQLTGVEMQDTTGAEAPAVHMFQDLIQV